MGRREELSCINRWGSSVPASPVLPEEHRSLLWSCTLKQTISLKGRGGVRVPDVPAGGPSCPAGLLGTAASFVSPYAAADLGEAALRREGGGSAESGAAALPACHLGLGWPGLSGSPLEDGGPLGGPGWEGSSTLAPSLDVPHRYPGRGHLGQPCLGRERPSIYPWGLC